MIPIWLTIFTYILFLGSMLGMSALFFLGLYSLWQAWLKHRREEDSEGGGDKGRRNPPPTRPFGGGGGGGPDPNDYYYEYVTLIDAVGRTIQKEQEEKEHELEPV